MVASLLRLRWVFCHNHFNLRRRFLLIAPYTTFEFNSKKISGGALICPRALWSWTVGCISSWALDWYTKKKEVIIEISS